MPKRDWIYVQDKRSKRENPSQVAGPESSGEERKLIGILLVGIVLLIIAVLASNGGSDTTPVMTPAGMILGGLIC